MKTRVGFVSNSSSSSFILAGSNTINLAREMLKCKEHNPDVQLAKFDRLVEANKDFISTSIPIRFKSCNYDTFIRNDKDLLIINTCHNEDWNPALSQYHMVSSSSDENYPDDETTYYWSIEHDLFLKEVPYNLLKEINEFDYCKKHYTSTCYIFDKNTIGCPDCYKGLTFTQRNNIQPVPYVGKNIRRYLDTR